jgi:hypothetical protein
MHCGGPGWPLTGTRYGPIPAGLKTLTWWRLGVTPCLGRDTILKTEILSNALSPCGCARTIGDPDWSLPQPLITPLYRHATATPFDPYRESNQPPVASLIPLPLGPCLHAKGISGYERNGVPIEITSDPNRRPHPQCRPRIAAEQRPYEKDGR